MESFKKLEMIGHYSFILLPNLLLTPASITPVCPENFPAQLWGTWRCFPIFSRSRYQTTSCSSSGFQICLFDSAALKGSELGAEIYAGINSIVTFIRWFPFETFLGLSLQAPMLPKYSKHFSAVCFLLIWFRLSLEPVDYFCSDCSRCYQST